MNEFKDQLIKLVETTQNKIFDSKTIMYLIVVDPSKPEAIDRVGRIRFDDLFANYTPEVKIKLNQGLDGNVDGVNDTYTTNTPFVPGSIMVIQNGMFTFDFNEIDNETIQFNVPPLGGDLLRCIYEEA